MGHIQNNIYKEKFLNTSKMPDILIEVFTSPTCPHCPGAVKATKELFEKHQELKKEAIWKEISTASPSGYKKARSYGITAVPTIIITNLKTNEKFGITGTPSEEKYIELIYKAIGKEIKDTKEKEEKQEKNKEKKSIFDKFADLFK